jgi:predicted choloylglycine hydrolase
MELLWPKIVKKGNGLLENFPPDYREELETMIRVSGCDRDLAVAANTAFDLKQDLGHLFGCSALLVEAERSRTGQPIFGRNMDHFSLGYLHEYSLVSVYRPTGKLAFVSVGFPGLVGCISGMNEAGLALAVLETTGAPPAEGPGFNPEGIPFAVCYRKLLEECTTVAEAEKTLRALKRTTTTNLAVCDRAGSAVFEITPSRVVVRRSEQGIGVCTNHFCTGELKLPEPFNIAKTLDRFAILERARPGTDKLGVEEVHQYLDQANQGELTMQTMVFEPATLTIHVAVMVAKRPASEQTLIHLQVGDLLGRE